MRHIGYLLVALWALAAPLWAAENGVTTYTLDNGMQVVVIEDHRAPVVTHMVWYKVGSADEQAGHSGIAHFLEHLLFKGTEKHPEGEFRRIIEANGGSDNAFTSYDYTAYFQRIAADRLGLMMEFEADRMRNLVLSEEDVRVERNVVIEERNQRVDSDPGERMGEQREAALYLNHPYGRPVIGWRHEIEALTREGALRFYDTYYAPNNAILIVAGDVEPEAVLALAREHYGPLAPSDLLPERTRPQEPPQLAERRLTYRDARVRQPYVTRLYLAPHSRSGDQAEAAALSVLADVLGGGITSHLAQTLQFDEQVALDAGAYYRSTGLDPQEFGVYAIPAEGVSLEEVEARLDAAIASFLEQGPDPELLERVKTRVRASEIYALDSQSGRARKYGVALTTGLTVQDVQAWPEMLQAVTADDVMAAADALFDRRRSVTAYLMSDDEEVTQ